METIDQFQTAIAEAVPGVVLERIESTPAAAQPSLLVDADHLVAVARFVRDDPRFQLDFC